MKLSERAGASILSALLLAWALISCQGALDSRGEPEVDIILFNGVVYTVDPAFSTAEAIAVRGKSILSVGDNDDIKALAGEKTLLIDLEGRVVLPGLVDAHAHMMQYAVGLDSLDLMGSAGPRQIADMVSAKAGELEADEWILGWGWDSNDWTDRSFPTKAILDAAAPQNPVLLTKQDGHSSWANSQAMRLAGITRDTPDPDGGSIIRGGDGEPTGIFIDNAMPLVSSAAPPPSEGRRKELLARAVRDWLGVGLTGIHDMGGGPDDAALVEALIEESNFPFRVYFNYSDALPNLGELLEAGPRNFGDGRLIIRSMKSFADGSLGSRSAAMLEPFNGTEDNVGLVVTSEQELRSLTERCLKAGFQVSTHACGDRGARMVLDAYEAALQAVPTADHRLRVEHAQLLAPEDIPRFKALGVLPSMQPYHCVSDFPWGLDLLGPERAKGAYAWRSLLDTGVIIPCGSDFPVERTNPFYGFYAAITRQHEDGTPPEGYFPEQRMTRQEALKGFTIWAACAAFAEDWSGSLEAGKRADLVVIDRDIMKIPPRQILETRVVMTLLDGRIVYNRDGIETATYRDGR